MDDRLSSKTLSDDLKEEIRTSWRHFRPSSVTDQVVEVNEDSSTNDVGPLNTQVDIVDQQQNFDSQIGEDGLFFDAGLNGFRVPLSEFSPPCVTHSNVNVIGDPISVTGKPDLDWWNYYDSLQPDGSAVEEAQELNDKKTFPSLHVNGVGSPSTATDSPFWKIPKSASLPNNDW